jgi:hypothetical protein
MKLRERFYQFLASNHNVNFSYPRNEGSSLTAAFAAEVTAQKISSNVTVIKGSEEKATVKPSTLSSHFF